MGWFMNLGMLGAESAEQITERSPNGVMGARYNFIAKTPSIGVTIPVFMHHYTKNIGAR